MTNSNVMGEKIFVVAVCDNVATTYGLPNAQGKREFVARQEFNSYGEARMFAIDYETAQRTINREPREPKRAR